jgi:glyoxylase I family protein
MMQVTGIDHVVLRVKDLAASLRFYTEVLGCPLERRRDDIGLIQLRAGSSLIDLVPVDGKLGRMGGAAPGPEGRNLDHLCLRIAGFEAEAVRAELEAAGVAVGETGMRYGSTGEALSIYVTDPDGNGVELRA